MKIFPRYWYHFWNSLLYPYMHFYLNLRYTQKAPFPKVAKVFAVNHPTVWDAFPILIYWKTHYLSVLVEEQIWSFPLPRFIFKTANQIILYNKQRNKTEESIKDALQVLRSGQSILISPEGGRTDPAELVRGKRGTIRIAIEAKAPIIPIGVWIDPDYIKEKRVDYQYLGEKYFDIAPFPKFRAPYGVVFGEPIFLDAYSEGNVSMEECQTIADNLLSRIYALASEARSLFPDYPPRGAKENP
jgi:1-acyl-sn-glycerol-3-phosphate acyltransferase